MKALRIAMLAIAMLFASALPALAETAPTKAAVVRWISTETRNAIAMPDIVRIVNAAFKEAKKHSIDPFLILSLINTESKFRSWAKNKSGARGLTQVIPRWHRDKIKNRNIMHIETNIEVGTQVLVDCLERSKGYVRKALSCYSGGARNYASKLKAGYTEAKKADILYRFENDLPLAVVSSFEEPDKFSISENPDPTLAAEKQIYASSIF